MTHANLSDVSTRLGRPITDLDEIEQVNTWLADIEAIIKARIPALDTLVVSGAISADVVVMVEANAVIRKIKNPDGKVSEGIDDYNYRLNENSRKGELFLTDEEWALISPSDLSGAWTIHPRGARRAGEWIHPDVWVPAP